MFGREKWRKGAKHFSAETWAEGATLPTWPRSGPGKVAIAADFLAAGE